MRDLKFRAYDKVAQEFIYSDKTAGGMWRYFKILEDRGIRHFESQQFTGLLDKQGKEIFEGDIVDLISDGVAREPAQVCWNDDSGGWIYRRISSWDLLNGQGIFPQWKPVEVIGDIFSNPELLKES